MNVLRSGVYSGMATVAKLLSALLVLKLVAVYAGPAGVARLGQFTSLMSLLAVLAGGGIGAGVVKYAAEYRDDPGMMARLLGTALGYTACAAGAMVLVTLLCSRQIAQSLLGDAHYQSLICALALAQLGIALLNYTLAVVNGFMDMRRLAFIQVVGAGLSMLVVACLAGWLQLYGALLGLVLGQLAWLCVGLPTLRRSPYFRREMFRIRFDTPMVRRLAAFSVMTLASALLPLLVNIGLRDHLANRFGWQQVGYWQAVGRVSDAYLLFFTSAINVYYLPKLAALQTRTDLLRELRAAYRYVLPAVSMAAVVLYLCRDWVTRVVFDSDFAAATPLYAPQLIGDVLKIASFVLSYLMLAKAMTRLFVISECVFAISYLGLVYLFTARMGLIGATYAFACNYALYLLFNVVVARHYLRGLR